LTGRNNHTPFLESDTLSSVRFASGRWHGFLWSSQLVFPSETQAMSAAASASLKSRIHPVPVLTSPLLYIFDMMTIVTTVDSKKKDQRWTMPKTDEERAHQKADTIEKKIKLKVAIVVAIEAIDKIINDLVDEHRITFERASMLVHLGGCIFKDRRRPSIQNAYQFCLAHVEDGRCKCSLLPCFSYSNISLTRTF
jgi:hypothetical protein